MFACFFYGNGTWCELYFYFYIIAADKHYVNDEILDGYNLLSLPEYYTNTKTSDLWLWRFNSTHERMDMFICNFPSKRSLQRSWHVCDSDFVVCRLKTLHFRTNTVSSLIYCFATTILFYYWNEYSFTCSVL